MFFLAYSTYLFLFWPHYVWELLRFPMFFPEEQIIAQLSADIKAEKLPNSPLT